MRLQLSHRVSQQAALPDAIVQLPFQGVELTHLCRIAPKGQINITQRRAQRHVGQPQAAQRKKHYLCPAKKTTMETETISHEGVVTKITDDELEIKILAQSACAACHAKSACGMGEQAEKVITVPRPKDKTFEINQRVNVKMAIGQGNKAAVLAYLIPIMLLLAVLFVCLGLGMSEGWAALISILVLVPYYIGLYLRRDKLKQKFEYTVE